MSAVRLPEEIILLARDGGGLVHSATTLRVVRTQQSFVEEAQNSDAPAPLFWSVGDCTNRHTRQGDQDTTWKPLPVSNPRLILDFYTNHTNEYGDGG